MPAWRLSRYFLGSATSIREARRFITTFLGDWPIAEAAELIVSELATNAVRHSASGRFGGRFLVTVHAGREGGMARRAGRGRAVRSCRRPRLRR
jgi:serine/threonine-protein kinase RsbW